MIDLAELGFENTSPAVMGRPSYSPAHLAKLYLFGYESAVRSSRRLEHLRHEHAGYVAFGRACPRVKTIADFRKDNSEALCALFCEFIFLDSAGCYGKRLAAIDGTKIKASNSKKSNFTKKKLSKHIAYHKEKIKTYLKELEDADDQEACERTQKGIEVSSKRIEVLEGYVDKLEHIEGGQLSLTDPDARPMACKTGVDVAYNVQAVVDHKHHLVADFDVTCNPTDHGQLAPVAEATQKTMRKKDIRFLADKGYYAGAGLKDCERLGIDVVVARQNKPGEASAEKGCYSSDKFCFDAQTDSYTCPAGAVLTCKSKPQSKFKKYHNKRTCKICACRSAWLSKNSTYRHIRRNENSDALDRAAAKYAANIKDYKLRQQIVEHVFGTVKRTLDGGYFLVRTKEKVKAAGALFMLCYNMKRARAILGFSQMMGLLDRYGKLYGKSWALQRACAAATRLIGLFNACQSNNQPFSLFDSLKYPRLSNTLAAA